jgi:hypothetical protein
MGKFHKNGFIILCLLSLFIIFAFYFKSYNIEKLTQEVPSNEQNKDTLINILNGQYNILASKIDNIEKTQTDINNQLKTINAITETNRSKISAIEEKEAAIRAELDNI